MFSRKLSIHILGYYKPASRGNVRGNSDNITSVERTFLYQGHMILKSKARFPTNSRLWRQSLKFIAVPSIEFPVYVLTSLASDVRSCEIWREGSRSCWLDIFILSCINGVMHSISYFQAFSWPSRCILHSNLKKSIYKKLFSPCETRSMNWSWWYFSRGLEI